MDEMTFTLHSPLTEEELDLIEDVDFDHTNSITFHTKHGKNVKFVKRKTEWIPCSERLPEESGRYLVTANRRQLPEKTIPICIVFFKNGKWRWDFDDLFDEFPVTITAWMPLPEPYKEGERNDDNGTDRIIEKV